MQWTRRLHVEFSLEVGLRIVPITVREESVHDHLAQERGEEAEGEAVRHKPLFHSQNKLAVAIVTINRRLRLREVVQHSWRLARHLVVGDLGIAAFFVILQWTQQVCVSDQAR